MTYRKNWTPGEWEVCGPGSFAIMSDTPDGLYLIGVAHHGAARCLDSLEIPVETAQANAHLLANAERLFEALEELVGACEYVAPFAGAVATEASVKHIRQAGRFVAAMDKARAALLAADGQGDEQ